MPCQIQKIVVAIALFSTLVFSADDYSTWSFSKSVILNTTASGANISGDVTDFPVLIRLTTDNFSFQQAQTAGQDIRFAKTDGTHLPYEIEYWNNTENIALIWVKSDIIYGNNNTQSFLMYWGKGDAADSSNSTKVFDVADNYAGVWHLQNISSISDATGRGNTGINSNASNTAGIIGNAAHFVIPGSQNISIPAAALNTVSGSITISLWTYGNENQIPLWANSVFEAVDFSGERIINAHLPWDNQVMYWDFGNSGGCDRISKMSTAPEQKGQWNHWVFTHNSGTGEMRQYLNGQLWNSGYNNTRTLGTPAVFKLGSAAGNAFYYAGSVDEFQISNTERPANWIKLCYENQKENQVFVTIDESIIPPAVEDYSLWQYSQMIRINTTVSGVHTTNTLYGFPLLVRLMESNFDFSQALSNGQDIRFSLSDEELTPLPFETEKWDQSNKEAQIWVKIDEILPNNNQQYIVMYWGKPDAGNISNGPGVFDVNNNFTGVWHLNDVSNLGDATGRGNTGTNCNATNTVGVIGNAVNFVIPESQNISIPPAALDGINGDITISLWVFGGVQIPFWANSVFEAADANGCRLLNVHLPWDNQVMHWDFGNSSGCDRISKTSFTPEQKGQWNHWVFTHNSSSGDMKQYLNGQLWNIGHYASHNLGVPAVFKLGSDVGNSFYYAGSIDEFQISKSERSPDWIRLSYENQKYNPNLLVFGALRDIFHSEWAYSPTFSTMIKDYVAIVPADVDALDVSATPMGDGMEIFINGSQSPTVALNGIGIPTDISIGAEIAPGVLSEYTLSVTRRYDYVIFVNDNSPCSPGAENGNTWNTAFKDLQQALDKVGEEGKEIWVAEGLYRPSRRTNQSIPRSATFLIQPGTELIGGFEGTESAYNGTDCIREPQGSAYQTILSGDINNDDVGISSWPPETGADFLLLDDNVYHVVTTRGATGAKGIYMRNFIIKGGVATGASYSGIGGGIYNPVCSPSFEFCGFIKNISNEHGGGMYSGNSIPLIKNCLFQANVSLWGNGAGLYIKDGDSVLIDASVFDGNEALDTINSSTGGACYFAGADVNIVNSIMAKNTATNTGASVFCNQSTVSIINSTFSLNESPGASITGDSADISVVNTILWDDDCGSELAGEVFDVSYSCVKGGYAGTGNISSNPEFVSPSQPAGDNGSFGDMDDGLNITGQKSPCENTGLDSSIIPSEDIINVSRITGGKPDIGAYEAFYLSESEKVFGYLNKDGVFVPDEPIQAIDTIKHWWYVNIYAASNLAYVAQVYVPKNKYTDKKSSIYSYFYSCNADGSTRNDLSPVTITLYKIGVSGGNLIFQSQTSSGHGKPMVFVMDKTYHNWNNNWAYVISTTSGVFSAVTPYSQF